MVMMCELERCSLRSEGLARHTCAACASVHPCGKGLTAKMVPGQCPECAINSSTNGGLTRKPRNRKAGSPTPCKQCSR